MPGERNEAMLQAHKEDRMSILWAVVTIAVVVALLGLAGWTFVIAPLVVPTRHPK